MITNIFSNEDLNEVLDSKSNDVMSYSDYKKSTIRQKKREKAKIASSVAYDAAEKFLAENPNINVGFLIEHLQKKILSTTACCTKLGISPGAFLRLRKKYNLEPVYSLNKNNYKQSNKRFTVVNHNNKAIKNFYNPIQLNSIPQSEIETIQLRAARSLKFPNGENTGWKWTCRGYHLNGKLKARTNNLTKLNVRHIYLDGEDKYIVNFKGYDGRRLSRKEVDALNFKISKLKAFL